MEVRYWHQNIESRSFNWYMLHGWIRAATQRDQVKRHWRTLIPCSSVVGGTKCLVTRSDGSMGEGYSFCSVKDNFCKKIGREIALSRALRRLGMPRAVKIVRDDSDVTDRTCPVCKRGVDRGFSVERGW